VIDFGKGYIAKDVMMNVNAAPIESLGGLLLETMFVIATGPYPHPAIILFNLLITLMRLTMNHLKVSFCFRGELIPLKFQAIQSKCSFSS
jgi:hypothetical protein